MIEYSIVIPVYNEEESLSLLFDEMKRAMDPLQKFYQIIFVNDCSSDRSPHILKGFQEMAPDVVEVINLPQRSGQTFAMKKGLEAAEGNIVVTLDADLQNDPSDIPRLLEKMNEGYDVVCGWRKARQDKRLKAILSKIGNILQRIITGMTIHDVSCTLRAYKKECVRKIPLNWKGQHRFIPLCLSLQGYRAGEIISHHRLRQFGHSKYSHKRIFRVMMDFFRILMAGGKK